MTTQFTECWKLTLALQELIRTAEMYSTFLTKNNELRWAWNTVQRSAALLSRNILFVMFRMLISCHTYLVWLHASLPVTSSAIMFGSLLSLPGACEFQFRFVPPQWSLTMLLMKEERDMKMFHFLDYWCKKRSRQGLVVINVQLSSWEAPAIHK